MLSDDDDDDDDLLVVLFCNSSATSQRQYLIDLLHDINVTLRRFIGCLNLRPQY